MRVIQFIIFVVAFGWCCLLVGCDVENNDPTIIAPKVFMPDSDEDEKKFFIVQSDPAQVVSLKIYTRAGVLIFSVEAKLCVWDGCSLSGQPMAEGVYYYTAEIPGSSPKVSKSDFVYLYREKK